MPKRQTRSLMLCADSSDVKRITSCEFRRTTCVQRHDQPPQREKARIQPSPGKPVTLTDGTARKSRHETPRADAPVPDASNVLGRSTKPRPETFSETWATREGAATLPTTELSSSMASMRKSEPILVGKVTF